MRRLAACSLVALLAALDVPAQTATVGEDAYPNKYPPALPGRKGPPPPKLLFEPAGEISVPGPLPQGPLVLDEGRLRLEVAGGWAWVEPRADTTPELRGPDQPLGGPAPPLATDDGWLISPSGDLRFRIDADGRIRAQRRSALSRDGWRRAWTIKTPRAIAVPPLLIGRRLFFTGVDARVYAVRADNGHRLWAVDLGGRVSRPLTRWSGTIPALDPGTKRVRAEPIDVLLVVPDSGDALQALDAYDGSVVGVLRVPAAQGWLTSSPVVVSEARVAVARQGYVPEEAALALFDLRSPEEKPGPDGPAEGPSRPPPL